MHIKVDEDLPPVAAQWLQDRGYQASTVVEQNRAYPPGTHGGVLLLRPDKDGIYAILDLLQNVIDQVDLDMLTGTISVATTRGLRVRRV